MFSKIKIILLINFVLMLGYSQICYAQEKVQIYGLVLDTIYRKPVVSATVYVRIDSTNTSPLISTSTDKNGLFELNVPKRSTINLYIEHPFFKQKSQLLVITGVPKRLTFTLETRNINLKEVNISWLSLITQHNDRLVYNVDRDPQALTSNVLNIIERVPLLSLDGTDNIKYLGTSTFKVLLNGNPSASLSRNVSEVLRNMPANTIKSIEVITNPSGKFYQEGVTAVINIVTKKPKQDGYEGTVYLEYKAPAAGPGTSVSFNFKHKKISSNTFFGYLESERPETSREYSSIIYTPIPNSVAQFGSAKASSSSKTLTEELSYDIDSLNLITARLAVFNQQNQDQADLNTQFISLGNTVNAQYRLINAREIIGKGIDASIDYQRNFAKLKGKMLTISYLFSNTLDNQLIDVNFANSINILNNDYSQLNRFEQAEHTGQIDYTQKIGQKLVFDAGAKAIFRIAGSENSTSVISQQGLNEQTESYNNNQYIPGVYTTLKYQGIKFGWVIGARLEETIISARYNGSLVEANSNYLSLIPNLSLNYSVNKSVTLALVYNRSLQRPNISYLNPFINQVNPTLEIAGNPGLRAVRTNNLNLQFRRFKKSSIVMSLLYSFSSNRIQRIITDGSTEGITRFSFENIGRSHSAGFNISYNVKLNKYINLNASQNTLYTSLNGDFGGTNLENSGYTFDYNLGLTVIANAATQFSTRASYSTPSILLQGKTTTYPNFAISGNRTFLKNKIGIMASVINPFSKFVNVTTTYNGAEVETSSKMEVFYRSFTIRASYKFGELRSRSRRGEKSISNQDSMTIK